MGRGRGRLASHSRRPTHNDDDDDRALDVSRKLTNDRGATEKLGHSHTHRLSPLLRSALQSRVSLRRRTTELLCSFEPVVVAVVVMADGNGAARTEETDADAGPRLWLPRWSRMAATPVLSLLGRVRVASAAPSADVVDKDEEEEETSAVSGRSFDLARPVRRSDLWAAIQTAIDGEWPRESLEPHTVLATSWPDRAVGDLMASFAASLSDDRSDEPRVHRQGGLWLVTATPTDAGDEFPFLFLTVLLRRLVLARPRRPQRKSSADSTDDLDDWCGIEEDAAADAIDAAAHDADAAAHDDSSTDHERPVVVWPHWGDTWAWIVQGSAANHDDDDDDT